MTDYLISGTSDVFECTLYINNNKQLSITFNFKALKDVPYTFF